MLVYLGKMTLLTVPSSDMLLKTLLVSKEQLLTNNFDLKQNMGLLELRSRGVHKLNSQLPTAYLVSKSDPN